MSEEGEEAFELGLNGVPPPRRAQIDAFEDWSDLPDGADLVTFCVGPRGGVIFNSFSVTPKEPWVFTHNEINIKYFQITGRLRGISTVGPISEWRIPLRQFKRDYYRDGRAAIDLGEFARKYLRL